MLSSNELDHVGLVGEVAIALDSPQTLQTRAMLELWKSKLCSRDVPFRSDFSPAEMKDYLDHIYIIEVIDGGADFLVRLAGTALTGTFGEDFTGIKFSDERLKEASWRLKVFRSAFNRLEPVMYRFRLGSATTMRVMTENLILPVRDKNDGHIILMCVSIIVGDLNDMGQLINAY